MPGQCYLTILSPIQTIRMSIYSSILLSKAPSSGKSFISLDYASKAKLKIKPLNITWRLIKVSNRWMMEQTSGKPNSWLNFENQLIHSIVPTHKMVANHKGPLKSPLFYESDKKVSLQEIPILQKQMQNSIHYLNR